MKRAILLVAIAACTKTPPPAPAPLPPASVAAVVDSGTTGGASCGDLGCTQYDSIEDAFKAALASKPLVVAIGEAHAQKGKEGIASSAKRFTDLLPMFKDRASDLIVELMMPARLPDGGACVQTAVAVKEKQKVVTGQQASTNQNEYVEMGNAARKQAIIPDLLRPTCDDLAAIDKAGDDMIAVSLSTIARLTKTKVGQLLDRNARTPADADKIVVTYGGALHNDVAPKKELADFSFGPDLIAKTGGRYVEIDLYVSDYIEDTDNWKKMEWYAHYDKAKLGGKVTVFHPREQSWVILFPLSK